MPPPHTVRNPDEGGVAAEALAKRSDALRLRTLVSSVGGMMRRLSSGRRRRSSSMVTKLTPSETTSCTGRGVDDDDDRNITIVRRASTTSSTSEPMDVRDVDVLYSSTSSDDTRVSLDHLSTGDAEVGSGGAMRPTSRRSNIGLEANFAHATAAVIMHARQRRSPPKQGSATHVNSPSWDIAAPGYVASTSPPKHALLTPLVRRVDFSHAARCWTMYDLNIL